MYVGSLDCGKISPMHDCGMDSATANKYYTAGPPHMLEQVYAPHVIVSASATS